jgi:hypothetical protein
MPGIMPGTMPGIIMAVLGLTARGHTLSAAALWRLTVP